MSSRKDMPKHGAIVQFWCDTLIEKHGKYWLDVFEDLGYINDKIAKESPCFACGSYGEILHRAHIVAICEGGSNHVNNIHLLCRACHAQSEYLNLEMYWQWFDSKKIGTSPIVENTLMRYKQYTKYLQDPEWQSKYGELFEELKNNFLNPKRTINAFGMIDYSAGDKRALAKERDQRLKQWELMFNIWIKTANQQKP
jgi:hypothetical protein